MLEVPIAELRVSENKVTFYPVMFANINLMFLGPAAFYEVCIYLLRMIYTLPPLAHNWNILMNPALENKDVIHQS